MRSLIIVVSEPRILVFSGVLNDFVLKVRKSKNLLLLLDVTLKFFPEIFFFFFLYFDLQTVE